MHITLLDAHTIRLEFSYSAAAVARVKALPGATWDKESKTWSVPLARLRRIVDEFPAATVDPACVEARLQQWRRLVIRFNRLGVWFALAHDGVTVVPTGAGVAPAFTDWVAAHSEILARFLGDQVSPVRNAQATWEAEPSHGDRLIHAGIQNAARVEDRRAEMAEQRRRGRGGQVEQMSLLGE